MMAIRRQCYVARASFLFQRLPLLLHYNSSMTAFGDIGRFIASIYK